MFDCFIVRVELALASNLKTHIGVYLDAMEIVTSREECSQIISQRHRVPWQSGATLTKVAIYLLMLNLFRFF